MYLISFFMSFFGSGMSIMNPNNASMMSIGFSLFVVVIASLNLVLDFDFIEEGAATRVGKASLNLRRFSPKVYESKVHHVLYLNEMSERSFIASLDGIITADICPGRPIMKEVLSQIDYLFILYTFTVRINIKVA